MRQCGVTLIELMIVMLIIGILTAIAYPSYTRYVARTHRNAAAACLFQFAQAMERRYATALSYAGAEIDLPCESESSLTRFYTIELASAPTQSTYTVRAVPTAIQAANEGGSCGTLSLDHRGARLPNGGVCW